MERARIYLVRATYIRGIARPAGAEDMQQLKQRKSINDVEIKDYGFLVNLTNSIFLTSHGVTREGVHVSYLFRESVG